jgi:GTP diphosphokinase / guanosine-3',5'-bis(diphosphate) 3'-diphosphatase
MALNAFGKIKSYIRRNRNVKEIAKSDPNGTIGKAYHFAEKAHVGQKRKTGEPYFNHTLAVAEKLNEWGLDEKSIVAGLLHDAIEDTPVTRVEVEKEFGEEVAFLVEGMTKLGQIKYHGVQTQVENLRKLILALSEDLRVIFIKLADRLHNMKTLHALPPAKQKRIAMETDEIYAPLAARVGMQNLSGELHDLAFPYLYPKEYEWIKRNVTEVYEKRNEYLHQIEPLIREVLKKEGLNPISIDFRAKRTYSLYSKLLRNDMNIERIHDLVAMRLIMKTTEDCYGALGLIHKNWPPLQGRIKDYIAMPKPNGYRSLHTTVIGPDDKIIEFQIRSKEMHEENENGIAAHWLYKQRLASGRTSGRIPLPLNDEMKWLQQLKDWQENYMDPNTNPEEFLQAMKIEFFKDRIFVVTPRGDVIDLPAASTPVDFAYHIHSDLGDSCVGARVNNQIVPLDRELQSGDLVEILAQKNKKPSEDWLRFVKTGMAREHIRSALRKKKSVLQRNAPTRSELRVTVADRVGLIKDLSTVIAQSHINIISFTAMNPHGGKFPVDKIEIGTGDRAKIEKLILKLKRIKGVKEIHYQVL